MPTVRLGAHITVLLEHCRTRLGAVHIAATAAGLCRIAAPGEPLDEVMIWLGRWLPHADIRPAGGDLDWACAAINASLDGEPAPRMDVDLYGTPFQCRVWEAVREIPYGETRSYAEIARTIGYPRAGRAVGAANAVCPLPFAVPCHRVIGADGTIKGSAGDAVIRAMLLELEGVRLPSGTDTGRIL